MRSKLETPIESHMTWAEALRKGHSGWLMWIAMVSVLGCGFLIKGEPQSDFLRTVVLGAANGTIGPAGEKGAMILSGLLAGTPFYCAATSAWVVAAIEGRALNRDATFLVSIFFLLGVVFSLAQLLRVCCHTGTTPYPSPRSWRKNRRHRQVNRRTNIALMARRPRCTRSTVASTTSIAVRIEFRIRRPQPIDGFSLELSAYGQLHPCSNIRAAVKTRAFVVYTLFVWGLHGRWRWYENCELQT